MKLVYAIPCTPATGSNEAGLAPGGQSPWGLSPIYGNIIIMKRFLFRTGNLILAFSVWAFIAIDTLLVFILIAFLRPFDWNQRISYRIANLWGISIIRINPLWDLKISGTHHIKDKTGYVLIANHASLADIICLYCLGKNFKWLAKSSLFKIPFFGWTMSLLNYIPLKRGEHGSIRDSFQEAVRWLEKDISVLIFPEGTRSRSGQLAGFKNGAFKLALLTKKPIVPIVIRGTGKTLSKGKAMMATTAKGALHVLPEIDVAPYLPDRFEELKADVWKVMNEELVRD